MRFAITMLCFIGIASVIGTILKQNEPYENYIIKFGQFWFEFFEAMGLYNVYQAFWFLLILIFLIISTSFCVSRNSPKILKEYKKFQMNARERSLKSFKHTEIVGDIISYRKYYKYKENIEQLFVSEVSPRIYQFTIPAMFSGAMFPFNSSTEHEEYLAIHEGNSLVIELTLEAFNNLPKNQGDIYNLNLIEE